MQRRLAVGTLDVSESDGASLSRMASRTMSSAPSQREQRYFTNCSRRHHMAGPTTSAEDSAHTAFSDERRTHLELRSYGYVQLAVRVQHTRCFSDRTSDYIKSGRYGHDEGRDNMNIRTCLGLLCACCSSRGMHLCLWLGQQEIFPGSGELVAAGFCACLRLPSPYPGAEGV